MYVDSGEIVVPSKRRRPHGIEFSREIEPV
jgi:hypothetical protein